MRILHATHDFLPRHQAGAEIYAHQLCQELSRSHSVQVLCADYDLSKDHGSLSQRTYKGLPITELTNNWTFSSFAETYGSRRINGQLWRALGRLNPDLLHLHNLATLSLDLPSLARLRGIPCVATLHDYALVCPAGGQRVYDDGGGARTCHTMEPARCARCFAASPQGTLCALGQAVGHSAGISRQTARLARLVQRRAPGAMGKLWEVMRSSLRAPLVTAAEIRQRLDHLQHVIEAVDLFIAPSRAMAEFFIRHGVPGHKLKVSDYGMAPLSPRQEGARTPGKLRLGFVGTLAWHKGAHLLLEALGQLPREDYELKIFGDLNTSPAYADTLRRQARELPVRFMGPFSCEDTARTYAQMDALVVPSLWPENSPLVIHEAFLAGVPVVAARAGGISELVQHKNSGLLFEPGDAADLAGALGQLVDQPQRLQQLRRGIPTVKTVAENAREMVGYYEEILGRKRTRRCEGVRRSGAVSPCSSPTPPLPHVPVDGGEQDHPRDSEHQLISVLLVTRDGMKTLPTVLDALRDQEVDAEVELVAVDSGSTDGTAALLRRRMDRLIQVRRSSFNHGLTRNLGLQSCRGAAVVLMVQDAVPASRDLLAQLTAPLWRDQRLAGTYARQLPRQNAGPLTREYARRWLTSSASPRLATIGDAAELSRLSPWEQYRLCCFDNVCSCIRRRVWQEHPFEEVPFAEDLLWAKRVLTAGHRLAYVPDARVLHSHERSASYELRRTYLAHRQLRAMFGLRTIPSPVHLALAVAGTMGSHVQCLARSRSSEAGFGELRRAVALSVALPLGQYLGALSSDTGRPLLRTGGMV